MKVTFCIKATGEGFVNFLQDFTKGVEMGAIPFDGQDVRLSPYIAGPPNNVAVLIPPEELASIPPGAVHPLAESLFRIGTVVFASVPHEHSDVQGRIVALFISDYPDEHDPLLTHSKTDERVAIGFKWTQIDEKLRVTMGCYEPVAADYFARLLKEISQIWPESREAIDEHLKGLGEQYHLSKSQYLGAKRAIDEHLKGLGEQSQEQATTDPTPKRDLPTLEQLLEDRRTRNRGLAEFFALGRWADTLESLKKALKTFAGDVPLIDGFPFTLEELTNDQTPCSKRWIFGCQFSFNHPADANSGFEGWPYAFVAAREAPGSLVVEFTYGRPYQAATRQCLRLLLDALVSDGLVVGGGQIAAQSEPVSQERAERAQAQARSEPKQGAKVGQVAKKATGAPRVQDRANWPDCKAKAYAYDQKRQKLGVEVAAQSVGHSKTTLNRWLQMAKREDASSQ